MGESQGRDIFNVSIEGEAERVEAEDENGK